ncbi:MAG: L-threonylcarbamoyladenylate synthase [Pseudobdellovibrionaceae bacterium]
MINVQEINKAAELLAQGDVVGLPTETVYGLAASIVSEKGIKKIFSVKERPFFDPLIVHVATSEQLDSVIAEKNEALDCLTKSFWPGPLTFVVPKNEKLNSLITSGLTTVGVRMPDHPVALKLIEKAGPLAAPSANKFGKTSPTTAAHVRQEFSNVLVLEGGSSQVGIESTILGITKSKEGFDLILHRPGVTTLAQIERALKAWDLKYRWLERDSKEVETPGQVKHHYMPKVPLIVVDEKYRMSDLHQLIQKKIEGKFNRIQELDLPHEGHLAARLLYAELRKQAESGADALVYYYNPIRFVSDEWKGIADRLTRAATLILDWNV